MKKFPGLLLLALLLTLLLMILFPLNNPRIRLQSQVFVNQPVVQVWSGMSDLSQLQNYAEFVFDSEVTSSQKAGEGAQRAIYLNSQQVAYEEVVEWDQNQGFVLKLQKAPFFLPFHDLETRYHVESGDEKGLQTDLAITLTVRPRFGLLGRWLLEPALSDGLQAQLDDLADGMKYFFETGLPVSESAPLK